MKVHEKPCLLSDDTIAILQETLGQQYPWTEEWALDLLETHHKNPLSGVLALLQREGQVYSVEFPDGPERDIMNRRSYTFGAGDLPVVPVHVELEPLRTGAHAFHLGLLRVCKTDLWGGPGAPGKPPEERPSE